MLTPCEHCTCTQGSQKHEHIPFLSAIYLLRTNQFTYLVGQMASPIHRDRIEFALQFDSVCPSRPSVDVTDAKFKTKRW